MTDAPKPSLSVIGIEGRYPAEWGPLLAANIHVQIFDWGDGRSTLRLEDESRDDAWYEVTVRVHAADEAALARLQDDGCPNGGES